VVVVVVVTNSQTFSSLMPVIPTRNGVDELVVTDDGLEARSQVDLWTGLELSPTLCESEFSRRVLSVRRWDAPL
jgi:hypothetical protein